MINPQNIEQHVMYETKKLAEQLREVEQKK